MEKRKPLPKIEMQDKPLLLLWRSLVREFYEEGNRGAELLYDLLVLVLAALFASTHVVFGVFPLGFALLCMCRRRVAAVALGCIIGAISLGNAGVVYAFVYIIILLLRALMSAPVERRRIFPVCEEFFSESVALRISLVLSVGLFLSLYEILVGTLNITSLLFCLGMLLLPCACALLFLGITESELRPDDIFGASGAKRSPFLRSGGFMCSLSALFFCLCITYSLRRFSIFGLSLDFSFLAFLVLFVSRRFGAIRSSVLAIACSLIINVTYAPSFGVLALISGLLWQYGSFYALSIGTAAAVAWAGYIGGVSGFVELAPEICVVAMLALPFFSRVRSEGERERQRARSLALLEQLKGQALPQSKESAVSRLSGAFGRVSELFYNSKKTKRPTHTECFDLCEGVCRAYCSDCENISDCWDSQERLAYRTVCKMADSLYSTGSIKKNTLSSDMFGKCCKFSQITDDILTQAGSSEFLRMKNDKASFVAFDYAMMAKLLERSASDAEKEKNRNKAAERALLASAHRICGDEVSVVVYGHRKKSIALGSVHADKIKTNVEELHESFEKICGHALSAPELKRTGGATVMSMQTCRGLCAEYASASVPSLDGEASGDRARSFFSEDDHFYSVISDGMGTGETAASRAELSVSFLENMIGAGAGKSLSLKMLNNVIRAQDGECSATVDLLELDLIYGKASFLKCGAATSYVKRGEDIFVIKSCTYPVGLLRGMDAQKTDFEVKAGDVIVMLSDGYMQCDDGEWLLSVLGADIQESLSAAASELAAIAAKKTERKDDVTVSLIRVQSQL